MAWPHTGTNKCLQKKYTFWSAKKGGSEGVHQVQTCGCSWGDLQAHCYGKKMWVRHLEAPLSTSRGVCEGGEEGPLHGIHYFRTHTTLPPPASNQHIFLIGTIPSHSIQNASSAYQRGAIQAAPLLGYTCRSDAWRSRKKSTENANDVV